MGSGRNFKFRIYQNQSGKYKIKNLYTGGTLGPEFDNVEDAKAHVDSKVATIKAAQVAGTKDVTDKS